MVVEILGLTHYAARLIHLNEYLAFFPGAKSSENICETELNEILLNSMPNSLTRQAYMQGFYYEANTCKKYVNILERM